MKNFFKIMLGIFIVLFLVLLIAMFTFSEKYHYEKSIVINAPVEKVWQHANSMEKINEWNPWMKLDPNMKKEYSGVSGQLGDEFFWDSKQDDAGSGRQKIVEIIPAKKVKSQITFYRPSPGDAVAEIVLTPEGNSTKVIWSLDSEMKRPSNIMKPMFDYFMKKSYTEGLDELKKLSEK